MRWNEASNGLDHLARGVIMPQLMRRALDGWACQAWPLRLNDPLRNVHPESTSWERQAHEADSALFFDKEVDDLCTSRQGARRPQMIGESVRCQLLLIEVR